MNCTELAEGAEPMRQTVKMLIAVVLVLGAAACGGSASTPKVTQPLGPGNADRGQSVYKSTCAACHGGDATGVNGLGTALVDSEFIAASSESELVEFIKTGRPKDHPDNTTGRDMPRYGGNPNLSEQQLRDVAAYLISLN
jgi:mono/diheme cytochrome c family protein